MKTTMHQHLAGGMLYEGLEPYVVCFTDWKTKLAAVRRENELTSKNALICLA